MTRTASPTEGLLSIADISRHFSLPESTTRYYCKRFAAFIPSVGEGRRRRYRPETLEVIAAILGNTFAGDIVSDSYAVYEIGEDGGRTLVADGLKPADVLADGIDVTVNDTAAHRYEVVGSANVPEGADAVTVTYTATLAAVEEPEPGPDPDPTPDPSEKPDGDGTGDGTGAGTGDVQKPTPDAVAKTGADVFGLLAAVAALLAAGGVTLSLRRRANR